MTPTSPFPAPFAKLESFPQPGPRRVLTAHSRAFRRRKHLCAFPATLASTRFQQITQRLIQVQTFPNLTGLRFLSPPARACAATLMCSASLMHELMPATCVFPTHRTKLDRPAARPFLRARPPVALHFNGLECHYCCTSLYLRPR